MTKKHIKFLFVFSFLIFSAVVGLSQIKSKALGTTMSLTDASKTWPQSKFVPLKFKDGTPPIRASMVVDLIKSKTFEGKMASEVKNALGRSTGYFWNDAIPAYIISEGWSNNLSTWQVVFLTDHQGAVTNVVIQKNCCDP